MKKILAIILCFVMISCSVVTAFAIGTENSDGTVEDGTVLYHQEFGKNFVGKDFVDAGMTNKTDTSKGTTEINDDGFLSSRFKSGNYRGTIVTLPDLSTGTTYTSYTMEVVFRFTKNASDETKDNAYIYLGFDEDYLNATDTTNSPKVGVAYNSFSTDGTKFNNADSENEATTKIWNTVNSKWLIPDGANCGAWVKMSVAIKDQRLHKMTLSCDGAKWESIGVADKFKDMTFDGSQLYIYNLRAGFDISSVRVVSGVEYTTYKGEFAARSYDGYEPTVHTRGAQLGTAIDTANMARLVGEIRGKSFTEAGFLVQITNGNDVSDPIKMPIHTAYRSLLEGNVGVITPSYSNDSEESYYLIAMKIDLSENASSEALKITFQPYATNDDGTYYGITYDFNCINKVVTRASTQLNEVMDNAE